MRFIARMLGCVGLAITAAVLADPEVSPSPPATASPAAAPAAPASTAPAAPTAPASNAATAPKKASYTPEEQRLIAMGYKPSTVNGERVFCRSMDELGSRLSHKKECGTAASLQTYHEQTSEDIQKMQHTAAPPTK